MGEPQPWDAKAAGRELLDGITAAIKAGRAIAELEHREITDRDIARAVLASPALREVNQGILDGLEAEYKPKIAAMIAADAGQIIEEAAPAIRATEKDRIVTLLQAYADSEQQALEAFPDDPGFTGAARAAGNAVLIAKGEVSGEGMMP